MHPTGLDALPPIVIALIAIVSGLLWQTAGALTLFRLTPRSLTDTTRLLLAWFLWLPVSGAAVLALVLMGVASRGVLLAGTALVAAAALLSRAPLKTALAEVRTTWARWKAEATPLQRGLFRGGVALQSIAWLFAGHPQRQIDQFNYHLVVGHLVVRDGQPFTGAMDPHVSFAGIVEYGLAWHQAWTHSTLLFIGMAQVAVMLAIVPVVIVCGLRLGGGSLGLFGVLLLAIPALIPEANMVHMAKPDGIVLAGVCLLLTLLAEGTAGWLFLALGICALCTAAKVTTLHAVPALLAAAWILRPPRGKPVEFAPLIFLGFAALALQWGKNTLRFGDPFFPAAAAFFQAPLWDDSAAEYWKRVAFEGRPRWRGLLGLFTLASRAVSLTLCLITAGVLYFRSRRTQRPEERSSDPLLKALLLFVLVYGAVWPLFYSDVIYPRFVSGVSAALLLLWLALHARLREAARPTLWVVSAIAALLTSQLDRSLPRLWRWTHLSAFEAMAEDRVSRLRTVAALQPELTSTDAVLVDRPEKIFFESLVIYPSEISLRERARRRAAREPRRGGAPTPTQGDHRRSQRSALPGDRGRMGRAGEPWHSTGDRDGSSALVRQLVPDALSAELGAADREGSTIMSRASRLLDLMQLLRRHRAPVTGPELARDLGISIRTLYRDIATLQAQGADIQGEPGLGYVLRPGFTLPPLMFSADELEALVLGSRWVAVRGDSRLGMAAENAVAKIRAVLPVELRESIDAATMTVPKMTSVEPVSVDVSALRVAIRTEHKVTIAYRDNDGAQTRRTIWPLLIGFFDRVQVVAAWCELRQDYRGFRVDRILELEATETRYPRRRAAMVKEWREKLGHSTPARN